MGEEKTTVRPLAADELVTAARMLTASFDEDPLFRFFLPRSGQRAAWLRWFHVRSLREAFAVGGAFTVEGGAELGAIAAFRAGRWPPPLRHTLAALDVPTALPTWRWVRAGLHVERRIHALHPAVPHLYVLVLGVHPAQKGRGLGAALLRHAFAMAKAEGVIVHLETSNPVNLPFYRRFGLEVVEEITSHGGPPLWTMTARG